jgi:hypothetical protein
MPKKEIKVKINTDGINTVFGFVGGEESIPGGDYIWCKPSLVLTNKESILIN